MPDRIIKFTPKLWAIVVIIEAALIIGVLSGGVVLYFVRQQQSALCTVFNLAEGSAQSSIKTNSGILKIDIAKHRTGDAQVRRDAIKRSTDSLIIIRKAQC